VFVLVPCGVNSTELLNRFLTLRLTIKRIETEENPVNATNKIKSLSLINVMTC
jgi:hypothetical protein